MKNDLLPVVYRWVICRPELVCIQFLTLLIFFGVFVPIIHYIASHPNLLKVIIHQHSLSAWFFYSFLLTTLYLANLIRLLGNAWIIKRTFTLMNQTLASKTRCSKTQTNLLWVRLSLFQLIHSTWGALMQICDLFKLHPRWRPAWLNQQSWMTGNFLTLPVMIDEEKGFLSACRRSFDLLSEYCGPHLRFKIRVNYCWLAVELIMIVLALWAILSPAMTPLLKSVLLSFCLLSLLLLHALRKACSAVISCWVYLSLQNNVLISTALSRDDFKNFFKTAQ